MDSRLPPEEFLGLKIGDAEVIRNGGGRVTADVLRFSSPAAATTVAVQYAQQYHLLRSAVLLAFGCGPTREACNESRASGLPVRYSSSQRLLSNVSASVRILLHCLHVKSSSAFVDISTLLSGS